MLHPNTLHTQYVLAGVAPAGRLTPASHRTTTRYEQETPDSVRNVRGLLHACLLVHGPVRDAGSLALRNPASRLHNTYAYLLYRITERYSLPERRKAKGTAT